MYSKEEETLRFVMLVFAIIFIIADIVFLFFTNELFFFINWIDKLLKIYKPIDLPVQKFYLALANAMMIMITYVCFKIFTNVKENLNLLPVLILAKFVSSVTGIILFFTSIGNTGYLVIFVADFPLFIIAAYLYYLAKKDVKIFT